MVIELGGSVFEITHNLVGDLFRAKNAGVTLPCCAAGYSEPAAGGDVVTPAWMPNRSSRPHQQLRLAKLDLLSPSPRRGFTGVSPSMGALAGGLAFRRRQDCDCSPSSPTPVSNFSRFP
jgi:hypothetical protein